MSTATRKPRVFISRTTAGLAALAERVAEVLRQRGIEPIIQTGFYPSTHDVKGMLAEHLQQCDAVICLIGTAYGSGPHDPITKAEQPVHGLKDPRTKDRLFSYTQLELLIARDLGRPEENPNDECRMPKLRRVRPIRHSSFRIRHLPSPLFKGRDEFLAELRQHLTAEGPVVIQGKRTIHGMGGVGKTRAVGLLLHRNSIQLPHES